MTEQQRSLYTRWPPHPWHGLASGADARRVVGGLKLIDRGEADGKILAVLEGDYVWGKASEIDELPPALIERIEHHFSTCKLVPGEPSSIQIVGKYGYAAAGVIEAALADYRDTFGTG